VDLGKKHKSNDLDKIKIKKQKTQSSYTEGSHHDKSEIMHIQSSVNDMVICPKGLVWNNTNYSCAYDALVSILYQLWCQDPHKWSEYFSNTSSTMQDLASSFQLVVMQETTFEQVRNEVRETLHTKFGDIFPYGSRGTSVVDLALKVFHDDNINASTQLQCVNCQFADEPV
jgi:hypothetical protein